MSNAQALAEALENLAQKMGSAAASTEGTWFQKGATISPAAVWEWVNELRAALTAYDAAPAPNGFEAGMRQAFALSQEAILTLDTGKDVNADYNLGVLRSCEKVRMTSFTALAAIPSSVVCEPLAERVQHVKRGSVYRVVGRGKVQTDTPLVDYAEVVVYQGESDGLIWVRPVDEFTDGRFKYIPPAPVGEDRK